MGVDAIEDALLAEQSKYSDPALGHSLVFVYLWGRGILWQELSCAVANIGGPLDNQTWHTISWPQQKLPRAGFHNHIGCSVANGAVFLSEGCQV